MRFPSIASRIQEFKDALEARRIDELRVELQRNVEWAMARVSKAKQSGQSRYWTQVSVPVFESRSPNFPFCSWTPTFQSRVDQTFAPILKEFYDMLKREALSCTVHTVCVRKGFLARHFWIGRFCRYYLVIDARSF